MSEIFKNESIKNIDDLSNDSKIKNNIKNLINNIIKED